MIEFSNHSTDIQQNITKECKAWTLEELQLMDNTGFWLKGVALFSLSTIGVILNLLAIWILTMKESSQNLFNYLLITLFLADTAFLFICITESALNVLILSDYLYFVLFPKFLYPGHWMAMTMSICMTIAIAHERFVAVRYPIKHRLQEKSAKFRRCRFLKYFTSSAILSVMLNIPHAFESEFGWRDMRNYTIINSPVYESRKFKYLDTYFMTKNPTSYIQR